MRLGLIQEFTHVSFLTQADVKTNYSFSSSEMSKAEVISTGSAKNYKKPKTLALSSGVIHGVHRAEKIT